MAALAMAGALLLIAAPAATATSSRWRGYIDKSQDRGVEFTVVVRHHHPVKVSHFAWFNVLLPNDSNQCPSVTNSDDLGRTVMRVGDAGRFHGRNHIPVDASAIVKGRFRHHGTRVLGTLELKGPQIFGCVPGSDADTGPLPFVAHRVT